MWKDICLMKELIMSIIENESINITLKFQFDEQLLPKPGLDGRYYNVFSPIDLPMGCDKLKTLCTGISVSLPKVVEEVTKTNTINTSKGFVSCHFGLDTSLALKGILLLAPGYIASDCPIDLVLMNKSSVRHDIRKGDVLGQLFFTMSPNTNIVPELDTTLSEVFKWTT